MNILKPVSNPSEKTKEQVQKQSELLSRMLAGDKEAGEEMNKLIEKITGIYDIKFPLSVKK
jgi:hypothetical protein